MASEAETDRGLNSGAGTGDSRSRASRGERFFVRFACLQEYAADDDPADLRRMFEIKLIGVLPGRHSLADVVGEVESDRVGIFSDRLIRMAEQFVLFAEQIYRHVFGHGFAFGVNVSEDVLS